MHFKHFCLQVLVVGLIGLLSTAIAAPVQQTAFTNPAKVIMLKPGQHYFTITLKSNPTTGFSWFWVPAASSRLIVPLSHHFQAAHNGLMGAPGVSEWRFKLSTQARVVPMTGAVALVYMQPWLRPMPKPVIFRVVSAQ